MKPNRTIFKEGGFIKMKVHYFLISMIILALLCGSCGKKKQPEVETSVAEEKSDTPPAMTDEDYVTYVMEYNRLKTELQKARESEDVELVQECQKKMLELDRRYPDAALYPTTLTQDQQNELGQKLAEAEAKLE